MSATIQSEQQVVNTINIPVEQITSSVAIRSIKEFGVKKLEAKIKQLGFLSNFPLVVTPEPDGNYKLIDGAHRLEAARRCELATVPAQVMEGLSEQAKLEFAVRTNEAAETVVPTTFVDQAELIWKLIDQGMQQRSIAQVMGCTG